eukprot:7289433-Pyramimonas_sp.AAC.1
MSLRGTQQCVARFKSSCSTLLRVRSTLGLSLDREPSNHFLHQHGLLQQSTHIAGGWYRQEKAITASTSGHVNGVHIGAGQVQDAWGNLSRPRSITRSIQTLAEIYLDFGLKDERKGVEHDAAAFFRRASNEMGKLRIKEFCKSFKNPKEYSEHLQNNILAEYMAMLLSKGEAQTNHLHAGQMLERTRIRIYFPLILCTQFSSL